MRPLNQLRTVTPNMPVVEALELMARENLNQLPVVSNGKLEGIFSRGRVLRFFRSIPDSAKTQTIHEISRPKLLNRDCFNRQPQVDVWHLLFRI